MSLSPGDIFSTVDSLFHYQGEHYCICVAITDNNEIIYVYTGSDLQKIEARCRRDEKVKNPSTPLATFVEIPVGTTPSLQKPCAVNCNNVGCKDYTSLIGNTPFRKCHYPLKSQQLLDRIIAGIKQSRRVFPKLVQKLP